MFSTLFLPIIITISMIVTQLGVLTAMLCPSSTLLERWCVRMFHDTFLMINSIKVNSPIAKEYFKACFLH